MRDPRVDPRPGDEVCAKAKGARSTWKVWFRVTGRSDTHVELDCRTETLPWALTGWCNLDWWRDRVRRARVLTTVEAP